MINALTTRCFSTFRTWRQHCAREASRWSRGTLIILVGFGCFLMLLGSLLTYVLAVEAYGCLARGNSILVTDAFYTETAAIWIFVLLLLFGGNQVRGLSLCELQRLRSNAAVSHPTAGASAGRWTTAGLLALCVGPIMLFWSALGLVSFNSWFRTYLSPWPVGAWPTLLGDLNSSKILNMSVWWCLSLAWLAGGVSLLWTGYRSLLRRPLMQE